MKEIDVNMYYGKDNFEQLFMILIQEKMDEIKEKIRQENEIIRYNNIKYYPSTSTNSEVDEKDE